MPFSSLSRKGVPVGGHAPSPGDDEHMSWFCMNPGTVCVECEEGLQYPSRAQPLGNPGPSETEEVFTSTRGSQWQRFLGNAPSQTSWTPFLYLDSLAFLFARFKMGVSLI